MIKMRSDQDYQKMGSRAELVAEIPHVGHGDVDVEEEKIIA